jgi:uncharacterized protein (TIGR02246 family)
MIPLRKLRTALLPILLAALCFHSAGTGVARADDAENKTAIQAVYDAAATALLAKDFEKAFALETDDYVWVNSEGKESAKAEADASTQQALESLKEIKSIEIKVGAVKTEGEEATAEVAQTAVVTITDDKGTDQAIKVVSKTRDVWVKTDAGWRLKRSTEIETKAAPVE